MPNVQLKAYLLLYFDLMLSQDNKLGVHLIFKRNEPAYKTFLESDAWLAIFAWDIQKHEIQNPIRNTKHKISKVSVSNFTQNLSNIDHIFWPSMSQT